MPVNVPGGDVTVQFVPDDTDEYKAPPDVTVHLTIEPAPLTVQAQSYTIVRGSPLPPDFAYTVTGLVNGDLREDVLDETQIAVNCGADGQTAGRFDITVSGGTLKSGNYKLEYVPGTLTVETPYVPPTPSHTHNWSTAWSCDGVGHWHECLNSGCDIQRRDYAGHIYDDGQDATCNICGYVREVEPPEPEHVHDWAAAWSTDDTYHWHECLAEGCGITDDSQKDGYSLHVYDDEQDEECSICGYVREVAPPEPEHVHNWAAEWSTDDAYHWHECLTEDCGITADGEKDGYGVHVYDDEWDTACNVCGYVREVEPPVPEHVHAWDRVWSGDSAHHWHECLAGGAALPLTARRTATAGTFRVGGSSTVPPQLGGGTGHAPSAAAFWRRRASPFRRREQCQNVRGYGGDVRTRQGGVQPQLCGQRYSGHVDCGPGCRVCTPSSGRNGQPGQSGQCNGPEHVHDARQGRDGKSQLCASAG